MWIKCVYAHVVCQCNKVASCYVIVHEHMFCSWGLLWIFSLQSHHETTRGGRRGRSSKSDIWYFWKKSIFLQPRFGVVFESISFLWIWEPLQILGWTFRCTCDWRNRLLCASADQNTVQSHYFGCVFLGPRPYIFRCKPWESLLRTSDLVLKVGPGAVGVVVWRLALADARRKRENPKSENACPSWRGTALVHLGLS